MQNAFPFTKFLRRPEVKRIFGQPSDTSHNQAIKDGLCTQGVLISQRSLGWPDSEIKAIAAARIQGMTENEIRDLVAALHEKRKTAFSDLVVSQ